MGQLVSVVIPSFNRAYCIRSAIDSALQQTHRDVEVLVVDDGSTDGTGDLLASAYAGEGRLRVLRQDNAGVSAARNHALREARGDFVAFLDSDDQWLPWKLEAQLACLRALPQAGMIWTEMAEVGPGGEVLAERFLTTMYSAYEWFGSREELFERSLPFARVHPALAEALGQPTLYTGDIFSQMVLGNLVHTSTVLLRRDRAERVGGFDERRRTGEDYDYHLRTCREGPVAYLDAASIRYLRGHTDQLTYGSDNGIQVARNFLATIEPVLARDRARIRLPRAVIREVLAEAHAWQGELHVERGERRDAVVHLAASLRHEPRQPRVAGLLLASLLPPRWARTARGAYRAVRARLRGAA